MSGRLQNGSMVDDPVAVVRSMWEAWRDGRMDDVVATMHPEVTWRPLTRPALTLYQGHDGIRRMRADVTVVHESFSTVVDDITVTADGSVMCHGLLIVEKENAEPSTLAFDARCVLRDGLIFTVDSYESRGD